MSCRALRKRYWTLDTCWIPENKWRVVGILNKLAGRCCKKLRAQRMRQRADLREQCM